MIIWNLLPLYSGQPRLESLSSLSNILTSTDFSLFFALLVQPAIQQLSPTLGFVSADFGKQAFLNAIPRILPSSITSNDSLTFRF